MHIRNACATPSGFLALAALLAVSFSTTSADVWTSAQPVLSLFGSGDILAGSTSGGVVLWDVPRARAELVTTARGLPSSVTLDIKLAAGLDQAAVATDNGVARGWFGTTWQHLLARNDEEGASWYCSFGNPGGGYVFGGARGALLAWRHTRVDSLRIPTRGGRIVGLDVAPHYFDVQARRRTAAQLAAAPTFPRGLVAALDNDGVWLLRDAGSTPRWLRIDDMDGLPSRYVRDVVVDARGLIWVATRQGLARLGPGVRVTTFADSLLSRRIETMLLWNVDGTLYLGVQDGIIRLDTNVELPQAVRVVHTDAPVIALAAAYGEIWWTSGRRVRSIGGAELPVPRALAANSGSTMAALDDTLWVGHTLGWISRFAGGRWTRHGAETGLPNATVESFLRVGGTLYVGTENGLYQQAPAVTADSNSVRFARVDAVSGAVNAQTVWNGVHWVGGASGLWRHDTGGWSRVALWPGAHAIVDLAVQRDTLWATAGTGGIVCNSGSGWQRPPLLSSLVGAYWGRMHVVPRHDIAIATDRGAVVWDAGILRPAAETPVEFFNDIAWWDDTLVGAGNRGLWLRTASGAWTRYGVFDGLPGARVRHLDVAETDLWVASTRGVGRFRSGDFVVAGRPPGGGRRAQALSAPSSAHRSARAMIVQRAAGGLVVVRTQRLRLDVAHDVARDATPTLRLDLYDVRGRLVRALHTRTPGGFSWDLRDARGRRVPNGTYFARVRPRGAVAPVTRRVVVLR